MRPILLIPILLLAIEGGVQAWRHADLPHSNAPLFCWKGARLVTAAPEPFGRALTLYRADRGAEQTRQLPGGGKMTVFYFEWDCMDLGPIISMNGHEAEVCNVAAGYKLIQSGGHRIRRFANGEVLDFASTWLAEPNGKLVYVYKLPWIQGFGAWQVNSSVDRSLRLHRSFLRHRGAGRVLEAGIFGAASEDEAWSLFQREVLDQLEWSGG